MKNKERKNIMADLRTIMSLIILKINRLNTAIKRQRFAEQIFFLNDPTMCCAEET